MFAINHIIALFLTALLIQVFIPATTMAFTITTVYMGKAVYTGASNTETLLDLWVLSLACPANAMVIRDVDGDNIMDVAVAGPGWAAFISGANGAIISNYTVMNASSVVGIYYIGDNNDNGYLEYLIVAMGVDGSDTRYMFTAYEPRSGSVLWSRSYRFSGEPVYPARQPYYGSGSITLSLSAAAYLSVLPGASTVFITLNLSNGFLSIDGVEGRAYTVYTNVLVGDLDGDGLIEEKQSKYTLSIYIEVRNTPIPTPYSSLELNSTETSWNRSWDTPGFAVNGLVGNSSAGARVYTLFINAVPPQPTPIIYSLDMGTGDIVYSLELPLSSAPVFTVVGDTVVVGGSIEPGGENALYLVDNEGGYREVILGSPGLPLSATGIGDVDGDGEGELLAGVGENVYLVDPSSAAASLIASYEGNVSFMDRNSYEHPVAGRIYVFTESIGGAANRLTIVHAAKLIMGGGGEDTSPPIVNIMAPPNSSLAGRSIYVVANVYDLETGISRVEASVEGNGFSLAGNMTYDPVNGEAYYSFEAPVDGWYTITVRAYNGAGLSSSDTVVIEVDAHPPEIVITEPGNISVVTNNTVTLEFIVNDTHNVAGSVLIDSSIVASWSGRGNHTLLINLSGVSLGRRRLSVVGVDEAGNVAEEYIYIDILGGDEAPPIVIIMKPVDGELYGRRVYVEAIVYDNESMISSVELIVSKGGRIVYSGEMSYDPLTSLAKGVVELAESGSYTVRVKAVNGIGLSGSDTVYISIDADPPWVEVISPSPGSYVSPCFTLSLRIREDTPVNLTIIARQGSRLWSLTMVIGGEGEIYANVGVNLTGFSNGDVVIYAVVYDEAGNLGVATARYVLVKSLVMELSVSMENYTVLTDISMLTVSATLNIDVNYTISIFIDGKLYKNYPGIRGSFYTDLLLNTTLLGDGIHNITMRGTTVLGYSYERNVVFYVDNTPPSIESIFPQGTLIWLGRDEYGVAGWNLYTLRLNASIAESLIDTVAVYIDGKRYVEAHAVYSDAQPPQFIMDETPGIVMHIAGGMNSRYIVSITINVTGGLHNVTLIVKDRAGFTTPYTMCIGIDREPPSIDSFTVSVTRESTVFYWSIEDTESGVERTILLVAGERTNVTGLSSYTFNLGPGNYTATLIATDKAGNTANKTISFEVKAPAKETTAAPTPSAEKENGTERGTQIGTGEETVPEHNIPILVIAIAVAAAAIVATYILFIRR